jgi:hypothetical protein
MISASQSRFDRAAGAILLRLRTQPSFNVATVHLSVGRRPGWA